MTPRSPPDFLRVDEKNTGEYYVQNVCGVIFTTNHKSDGIHLPADDRRHYVAWSEKKMEDFKEQYWKDLWAWLDKGGDRNVAAYLAALDISSFDPKAAPKKTAAFWAIVDASRAPESGELADVLDTLDNPNAVTLLRVLNAALRNHRDFAIWLKDRKSRRSIPHRMEQCGYVPVRNDAAKDGRWKISKTKSVVIYAKAELSIPERLVVASDLAKNPTREDLEEPWVV